MQLLSSLKNSLFAWLWSGQAISRIGDGFYRIALAWWVLEATGSAAAMGIVLIFSSVPMLIFLLIGGVTVDRFSRSKIMFASDIGRGLIALLVAFLSYQGALQIWHIYLASIIFGFVDAFFQPAYSALIPQVVPSTALPSANSLTNLSERLAGVVGPALGATIVAAGGTSTAFLLNAVTFFLSAICIFPALKIHVPQADQEGNIWQDFRQGFATVISMPWMWITILIAAIVNITVGSVNGIATPFLVDQRFGHNVNALGWIISSISIGSVITALVLGQFKQIKKRGISIYLATVLSGIAIFLMGLSPHLWGTLAAGFLCGVGISIFGLIWLNTLQEKVPTEQLGRVTSIDMLGSFVLMPIGYGIIGWLTDIAGASTIFIWCGLITIFMALLGLSYPAIRELD
jgi:MFS family permease